MLAPETSTFFSFNDSILHDLFNSVKEHRAVRIKNSNTKSTKTALTTRELVDAAIKNNGVHYLTYQLYPTKEQLYKESPPEFLLNTHPQRHSAWPSKISRTMVACFPDFGRGVTDGADREEAFSEAQDCLRTIIPTT